MGIMIGGVVHEVPGVESYCWVDDHRYKLKQPEDARQRRTKWVRGIVLHTTKGIPGGKDLRAQKLLPGFGPSQDIGHRIASWWSTSALQSGAHLVVDFDGVVYCLADLQNDCAFHAGPVNDVSVGVEIYQGKDAELYEGQLWKMKLLVDYITAHFGIQRQVNWPYRHGPILRLKSGGEDIVGIYGHRSVTSNRGAGDPGDYALFALRGYERFNFGVDEDRFAWRDRQRRLGLVADGIPGPKTVVALKAAGFADGLWTSGNPAWT